MDNAAGASGYTDSSPRVDGAEDEVIPRVPHAPSRAAQLSLPLTGNQAAPPSAGSQVFAYSVNQTMGMMGAGRGRGKPKSSMSLSLCLFTYFKK